jgi:hypothetical protein
VAALRLDGLTETEREWAKFLERVIPFYLCALRKVAAVVQQIAQQIAPMLLRMAQAFPSVKGYEAFLIEAGRSPLEARFFAYMILLAGMKLRQERLAERRLASAIYSLAKVEGASSLVVARRAKLLASALKSPWVKVPFGNARALAGISESIDSLKQLTSRAVERDDAACRQLTALSRMVRPHLRDPRGRIPTLASTTHELLFRVHSGAYTYDPRTDDMTDAATRATRTAMDAPAFDPRPARRRQRRQSR